MVHARMKNKLVDVSGASTPQMVVELENPH